MAVFRKFIYFVQKGKGSTFSYDSLSPPPSSLGATLKGKNLLPWVSTIKMKNKNDFFYLSEDIENCKMSGKNQKKVREF